MKDAIAGSRSRPAQTARARQAPLREKATASSPHRRPLAALGLDEPSLSRLSRYLDTLASWSRRVNLTAARTAEERVRVLVAGVLPALAFVRSGRLLDIGSGNGSPGLVIALLRDDVDATLLEPRLRRWAFLREAARVAGAVNVTVRRLRHDTYHGRPADTVTLRALALHPDELVLHVVPGGRLLILGAPPAPSRAFSVDRGVPAEVHVLERKRSVPRET